MYSIEVRFVALSMLHNNVPPATIYKNIGVRKLTLKRWAAYYQDHGSPWRDPDYHNFHASSCWFDDRLMWALVMIVRENPRSLLREHAATLKAMRDHPSGEFVVLRCSQSIVDLRMRRLGFSRKVVPRFFRESLEPVRRAHAIARRRIPRGASSPSTRRTRMVETFFGGMAAHLHTSAPASAVGIRERCPVRAQPWRCRRTAAFSTSSPS